MQMKILILSSEAVPFAKTGGLADVSSALCIELCRLGHDARLLIPQYTPLISSDKYGLVNEVFGLNVLLNAHMHICNINKCLFPGTDYFAYFVQYGGFFERPGLYSEAGIDYWDNPQRFAFLCKSALELCLHWDWIPDVIQCNDWQTALVPIYLKTHPDYCNRPEFADTRTVMSVHNLAYQGRFNTWYNQEVELPDAAFNMDGAEFYGDLNLLKGGLLFADKICTVSPTYAEEIKTQNFGFGLDGVLRSRENDLFGILNGIDDAAWNPATDALLPFHFSRTDMSGKAKCKQALQEQLGLACDPNVPLLGLVSRLDHQKGLELLLTQFDWIMQRDVQFAILGTGDAGLIDWLSNVALNYPGRVSVNLRFDEQLAHRIVAGSDLFLMPSRFEPCGLTQMYSMKSGTIPVARSTGGLRDSVTDATPENIAAGTATGFLFEWFDGWQLALAIDRAVHVYRNDKSQWEGLMRNGMESDFSWRKSAQKYVALYESFKS